MSAAISWGGGKEIILIQSNAFVLRRNLLLIILMFVFISGPIDVSGDEIETSLEEIQRAILEAKPMPFPDVDFSVEVPEGEVERLEFKYNPAERRVPSEWFEPDFEGRPGFPIYPEQKGSKATAPTRITNTETYPYSSVVHIYMDFGSGMAACSGAFAKDDHTIFTAGHCLYNHDYGGYPNAVYVIPGEDGSQQPFGYKKAYNWAVSSNWKNWSDYTSDWGVLLVEPFAQDTGYMDTTWNSSDSWYYSLELDTAGYPGAEGYPGDQMWWSVAPVDEVYNSMIRVAYNFSSYPYYCISGQSGSSMYLNEGGGDYSIVAVLTLASCHGVRMSASIDQFMDDFDCDGCFVSGSCWTEGSTNPDNRCQICDSSASQTSWTPNDGGTCDDGQFCNGTDTCDGGTCKHAGDPCGSGEVCVETTNSCEGGDDDDSGDDDSSTGDCSGLIQMIYGSCGLTIKREGASVAKDVAYYLCEESDGNWGCIAGCMENPDVSNCTDFVACLAQICDVVTDEKSSGSSDDESGDSCGS